MDDAMRIAITAQPVYSMPFPRESTSLSENSVPSPENMYRSKLLQAGQTERLSTCNNVFAHPFVSRTHRRCSSFWIKVYQVRSQDNWTNDESE